MTPRGRSPLPEFLRETRTQRGLTLEGSAREVGVTFSVFRTWEIGAAKPSSLHLGKLALWLQMPLQSLLRVMDVISDEEERALASLTQRQPRQGKASTRQSPRSR